MKPITVDLSIITRILIRLNSSFFNLSENDQTRYRVTELKAHDEKIEQILLQLLFKKEYSKSAWDDLELTQQNIYNAYTTYLTGLGEDRLFFNEFFPEGKSILDYETLYDYDFADHQFQEKHKSESDKSYKKRPYNVYLSGIWCRLFDKNKHFRYGTIESLAMHLHWSIEEAISEEIDKLIPNEYYHGENHGKPAKGGFIFDLQTNANGLEKELKELRRRCYEYQSRRHQELVDELHGSEKDSASVYMLTSVDEFSGDKNLNIVVKNIAATKHLRLDNFLKCCEEIETPETELDTLKTREIKLAKQHVNIQFNDIMKNFDPNVIPLQRKATIIAPEALFDDE